MKGGTLAAVLKSMLIVSIYIIAFTFYEFRENIGDAYSDASSYFLDLAQVFGLFLFGYFFLSIVGWATIGLPVHWLLKRFGLTHLGFYILAGAGVLVGLSFILELKNVAFYGGAIVSQVLVFRFCLRRKLSRKNTGDNMYVAAEPVSV